MSQTIELTMATSNEIHPSTQTITQMGSFRKTVLTFEDVDYSVQIPKAPCGCVRAAENKEILTGIR